MGAGLGKTVEVLGLILANPAPPLPPGVHKDANGLIKSRATLVVSASRLASARKVIRGAMPPAVPRIAVPCHGHGCI